MEVLEGQLDLLPPAETPNLPRRSGLAAAFGGAKNTGDASRDEARTPRPLFAALHRELRLELDVAASSASKNTLLNRCFCFDLGEDALHLPWDGRAWCNPPFSCFGDFALKARHEVLEPAGAPLVCWLAVFKAETKAWQKLLQPLAPQGCKTTTAKRRTGQLAKWSFYGWDERGPWGTVGLRMLAPRVDYLTPSGGAFEGGVAFGSAVVTLERSTNGRRSSPARRK